MLYNDVGPHRRLEMNLGLRTLLLLKCIKLVLEINLPVIELGQSRLRLLDLKLLWDISGGLLELAHVASEVETLDVALSVHNDELRHTLLSVVTVEDLYHA